MNARQLEAFNGVWAILAAFCVVFLIDHLRATGIRNHMSWSGWILKTPVSMQLAIATLALCVGVFFSRGAVWFWRHALAGEYAEFAEINIPVALGAFIGSWAFVCILRVVSRPRGRWPVVAALIAVAAYLATFAQYL